MHIKTPIDWDRRYRQAPSDAPAPARVVSDYLHLLPARGTALDLACGMGGNALALAQEQSGLTVHAWDYAAAAIEQLRRHAETRGLRIETEVRDVLARPPEPEGYDVITVSRFLDRDLVPALIAALRPGGLLYYQTFVRDRVSARGPHTDAFRLGDNELLRLFGNLRILIYREEGSIGDTSHGFRDEAMLIGQRRPD